MTGVDNFWDDLPPPPSSGGKPAPALEDGPPPDEDYGTNVVPLPPRRKRKQGGGGDGAPPGEDGWRARMHLSDSGAAVGNLFNAMLLLRNVAELAEMLAYDMMAHEPVVTGTVPGTPREPSLPRPMRDEDIIAIQEALQDLGLRRITKGTVQDAIMTRAWERRYHPVRDYLERLEWDGETRIDGWLSRYLGVTGSPYADKIGRLFLIAMVARVMRPGCKADYMLILEGPQGAYKSSACAVLAGEDWFSDSLPDLKSGDQVRLAMHLRGKWLIEIGELASFSNSQTEDLKQFLSRRHERYTPKYARCEVNEGRTALFVGTTNETAYLKDSTGARRFWPVVVGKIDLTELIAARDQLFAEALLAYQAGEKWFPDREFEERHIKPQQALRYEPDAWEHRIVEWLAANRMIWRTTVSQVMQDALGLPLNHWNQKEQRRVSSILKQLGWARNDGHSTHPYENISRRQASFDV